MTLDQSPPSPNDPAARRPFLIRLAAIVCGAIVALFPFAAGYGVLMNPLRRREGSSGGGEGDGAKFYRIGPLDLLPDDGVPRPFPVISEVVDDAWTRSVNQRVGLVFISRTTTADGAPQLTAFSATCPHLGCAVEFNEGKKEFECPCHASAFAKDGAKLFGPSLRGLDLLPAKPETTDGQTDIYVAYEKFQTGIAERKPAG
jgi:nitrite reductase/ring-hydroxylating ferredoxin subunit